MTNRRKGIILAGGSGTRLFPITQSVSKQLLPVYDKPMIYYPLTVLMLAGICEIAIITTPHQQAQFRELLGDGSQGGLRFEYIVQPSPDGLAQAFILAEAFLDGAPSALILGDNLFYGQGFQEILRAADKRTQGATIFGYLVQDPERYGVVTFGKDMQVVSIEEKPSAPTSDFAITGLYFFDGDAPRRARKVEPSARGELEITSLIETYLGDRTLAAEVLGRGFAWLDTGTHESLLEAAEFVRTIEKRQGLKVGSPDEVAFRLGLIDRTMLAAHAERYAKSEYGAYLRRLLK